jgi:hypothetical protein
MVTAGLLSVLIFPLVALGLLRSPAPAVAVTEPRDRDPATRITM